MAKAADFFFYFPSEAAAREAGQTLAGEGFTADVRPGVEEGTWLLLASKAIERSQLDALEARMQRLAAEAGGEYDGYEIEVRSR